MMNAPVEQQFRLLEPQKRALKRLGIHTLRDLLYHFPARYERAGARSAGARGGRSGECA